MSRRHSRTRTGFSGAQHDAAVQEVRDEAWMASVAWRDAEARLDQMEHNSRNRLRVGLPMARVKRFSVARPSS